MTGEWFSIADKELYMSLKGLINNNEGKFKSEKQYNFFKTRSKNWKGTYWESDMNKGEEYLVVSYRVSWGKMIWQQKSINYGFTFDKQGIKKLYKLPFRTIYIDVNSADAEPMFDNMEILFER